MQNYLPVSQGSSSSAQGPLKALTCTLLDTMLLGAEHVLFLAFVKTEPIFF